MKVLALAIAFAIGSTAAADAQVIYTRKSGPSGYLGINFGMIVDRNGPRDEETIKVNGVMKDSPADKAGIKEGDEVLRVNGMVASNGKFRAIAGTLVEGDTVKMRIRRAGRERDFTVVAARRPSEWGYVRREIIIAPDSVRKRMLRYLDSARVHLDSLRFPNIRIIQGDSLIDLQIAPYPRMLRDSLFTGRDSAMIRFFKAQPGDRILPPGHTWKFEAELGPDKIFRSFDLGARSVGGAEFTELNAALGAYFKADRGLLTVKVFPETPADRAGLQPGDVVLKAMDRQVETVSELRAIVAGNPEAVKLEILRKGEKRTIELRTRKNR